MKVMQEFRATCALKEEDSLVAYSGNLGIEVESGENNAVLSREDAIKFAHWILDVCEAESF